MNHKLYCLCAAATLFLGGCSGNLALPWESNLLDPSRIATREPLEIPPDLNSLPPTGASKGSSSIPKVPWTDPSLAQKKAGSDQTIHLPTQILENKDDAALSRTEQEKLPAWMEKDNKGSAGKGGR